MYGLDDEVGGRWVGEWVVGYIWIKAQLVSCKSLMQKRNEFQETRLEAKKGKKKDKKTRLDIRQVDSPFLLFMNNQEGNRRGKEKSWDLNAH